jgi:hypothetical protein
METLSGLGQLEVFNLIACSYHDYASVVVKKIFYLVPIRFQAFLAVLHTDACVLPMVLVKKHMSFVMIDGRFMSHSRE